MSLRRRVLVGFIAVAAVLIGTNLALASTFRSFLITRVDRQLVTVGGPLGTRAFFRSIDRGVPSGGATSSEEQNQALTEFFVAVGDPASGALTQINSALDVALRPPPKLERRVVLAHLTGQGEDIAPFTTRSVKGNGRWRVIAVQSPPDGRVTVLGISLDGVQATLAHTRAVQGAGTLAVLAALAFVLWWTIRLGVHPVEAMATTAEAISAGDLSVRVDHPDVRTEVGRLGAAFNEMLERIEEAFSAREASEQRVRRFAADASHELRTPLTSIQGYAELWRAGGLRDDVALADAMRRVEQEAHRMGALVEDLLVLARLDQPRLDARQAQRRAEVALNAVVADAVSDARAVEPGRVINAELAPAVVVGDEMGLRQVAANLLANARAHTPAEAAVTVSLSAADGWAELAVADEGPGMTPEVAAQVFERFYRADEARAAATGGTGLGLAIVDAIAQSHGGTARVSSAPGVGSRFVVRIPLAPVPPSGGAATP